MSKWSFVFNKCQTVSQQTCLQGCIPYKVAGFQKAGHGSCQASRLGVETVLLPCTFTGQSSFRPAGRRVCRNRLHLMIGQQYVSWEGEGEDKLS